MELKKNDRIGIWGYGIVGKALSHYFSQHGYHINIMDKRVLGTDDISQLQQKRIDLYPESEKNTFFHSSDYIFSSPGVNIANDYATHWHKWIHELDYFSLLIKKPIIAVTGSIGKTSVTTMLAALLKYANIPACVGGNIGTATFDLLAKKDSVDYALLEVSSFQLQYCTTFAPQLAILTNLYPNHLDHHSTEEEYFNAKQNVFAHQNTHQNALINLALRNRITHKNNQYVSYFSVNKPDTTLLLSLCNNERMYYIENNQIIRYDKKNNAPVLALNNTMHSFSFLENIVIITAAADLLHINPEIVLQLPQTTQLPEHRLEKVATINNIDFYDDSKSTTTASTLAAVEKLKRQPLHLFLGGLSKGVNRESFISQLKNQVKHIYCFGAEAEILHNFCIKHAISSNAYINLEDAFNDCIKKIKQYDAVLFSPAGSSYDLYNNFEERGIHFKNLVKQQRVTQYHIV